MIIKATLVTLVVILLVVIATSYYVNKEGFDNLTNTVPSIIKNQLDWFLTKLQDLNIDSNKSSPPLHSSQRNPKLADEFDNIHKIVKTDINNIAKSINDISNTENSSKPLNSTDLNKILTDANQKIRYILRKVKPNRILSFNFNNPDYNLLFRDAVRDATSNILRVISAYMIQLEINTIPYTTDDDKKLVQDALTSVNTILKIFIDDMNNSINTMNHIKFIESNTSATSTPGSSTPTTTIPAITSADITSALATPGIANAPPSTTGSSPTRTDVVPQVSFSDNGYNALMLQQKADLLKDIQKVVRNEVLANRSTTPMLHNDNYDGCEAENGHKDGCEPVKEHGCDTEDVPKNECDTKSAKDKVTAAISQGKEYENSCYKDKKSKASCPPPPDMAQFIKKDAIPCWGCNLDY